MRLERVERLEDYRIFRKFEWPADLPDFGRFNLIYGWNGSGKTALSTLLRHLQVRQSPGEGQVRLRIAGTLISGQDFENPTLPPIRVFNRDSVSRNVFELPHQELPAVYVLGEDTVTKQRELETIKAEVETKFAEYTRAEKRRNAADSRLDTLCIDRARAIKNLLTMPGGGPYNNYDKVRYKSLARRLSEGPNPPSLLDEQEREKCLVTKGAVPLEKMPLLPQLPDLGALSSQVEGLLGRTVTTNALEELIADARVAEWVHAGLDLHSGSHETGDCRFCNQRIPPERLARLRAHFNDEFNRFQDEIDLAAQKVEDAARIFQEVRPPAKALIYPHLAKSYEEQLGGLGQQASYVRKYLGALKAALRAKKDQPFRELKLLSFLSVGQAEEPKEGWGLFFHILLGGLSAFGATSGANSYKRLNEILTQHNQHTDNFAAEVGRARQQLEQDEVVKSLAEFRKAFEAFKSAGERLIESSRSLEELRKKRALLESSIKQHQRPAAELNREMAAYLGRDELRFTVRDNGYVVSRNDQPATNLSEGERTAIAFMYFLKSLSDTGFDITKGIVVVDDPISSLDTNSLYSAFGFMKARTADAGQIFVLTHNFLFFRQVRNWFHKLRGSDRKEARFYMLRTFWDAEARRTAQLEPLDRLLREYESEYHYLFKRVYDEAKTSGSGRPLAANYELPNIARRLLEAFLAFRVPGLAGQLYQQLDELDVDPARKARMLRFLDTYSHHEQIGSEGQDFSLLGEAHIVLADVLNLIEEKDRAHFRMMVKLVEADVN